MRVVDPLMVWRIVGKGNGEGTTAVEEVLVADIALEALGALDVRGGDGVIDGPFLLVVVDRLQVGVIVSQEVGDVLHFEAAAAARLDLINPSESLDVSLAVGPGLGVEAPVFGDVVHEDGRDSEGLGGGDEAALLKLLSALHMRQQIHHPVQPPFRHEPILEDDVRVPAVPSKQKKGWRPRAP